MRKSRAPFYILVGLLILAGSLQMWHRHANFNVSWLPGEKQKIWTIEAKVEFLASGDPVKVSLAIPGTQPGFEHFGEHTASPGYGLAFIEPDQGNAHSGRRAEWSIRKAKGRQTLYYRVDMLEKNNLFDTALDAERVPVLSKTVEGSGPYITEARQILQKAMDRSSDNYTLARELINEFNTQKQSAEFLVQKHPRSFWLVQLLEEAGVPAREVFSLNLEDGRRHLSLNSLIQVFSKAPANKNNFELFNPETGAQGRSGNQLLWEYQSDSLLDLVGGDQSSVYFSVVEQEVPASQMQNALGNASTQNAYLDFSIHSLPVEEQAMYKGILLIPVGVLVVVLMRIFVGLRTSGTFMPVLIAIAFIQTSLVTGLIGFLLIVGVGLMIRSYLSNLNLLLVARISAVIISVIIIIATFSVLASQLGLSTGLKITFFPMIILSWTIERMSILWEEEGPQQVFIQGGGSLFVAVITYFLMMSDIVRHLTFNFLGLQLILMAVILMMGNYTGYRLFELSRFKPLVKSSH